MAKKRIKLFCKCNVKGSEGVPGEVVSCDEKLAEQLIANRAGVEVEPEPPKRKATKKPVQKTIEPESDLT